MGIASVGPGGAPMYKFVLLVEFNPCSSIVTPHILVIIPADGFVIHTVPRFDIVLPAASIVAYIRCPADNVAVFLM